jgi:hypothetical protein
MSNGSMVQMAPGTVQKNGGHLRCFSLIFASYLLIFVPHNMCAFFSLYLLALFFWAVSAECIWACFCLGFSTAIWVSWFWGVWGGFGYVLTVYADAIHDIKMRFMSRCFLQCVASQPAWFSTASAVHLLPPRLAFSSAIILSLGGGVTGDRLI